MIRKTDFNLEAAINGGSVVTRDGRKVTNVRVSSSSNDYLNHQGLRAEIHNTGGVHEHKFYHDGGSHKYFGNSDADLFMSKTDQ